MSDIQTKTFNYRHFTIWLTFIMTVVAFPVLFYIQAYIDGAYFGLLIPIILGAIYGLFTGGITLVIGLITTLVLKHTELSRFSIYAYILPSLAYFIYIATAPLRY